MTIGEIEIIYKNYQEKYLKSLAPHTLNDSVIQKFNIKLEDDQINASHQIIIVAKELDTHTERIVGYLAESEIPINIVFFKIFEINGCKVLSRAWLTDPFETEEKASKKSEEKDNIPWNGEFYVSYGADSNRSWEDAKNFGFISAGWKPWYTRTLSLLDVGDRIWVNVPGKGYVGVGKVTETVQMAKDMYFTTESGKKNIYELGISGKYLKEYQDDEDKSEYIVKVEWEKVVDEKNAVKELGFFCNQNTVCKPANSKWIFTVDHLKRKWGIE